MLTMFNDGMTLLEARCLLDSLKAGAGEEQGISPELVNHALRVSGDLLGVKQFNEAGEQVLVLEGRP